jgi:hypothetical protein
MLSRLWRFSVGSLENSIQAMTPANNSHAILRQGRRVGVGTSALRLHAA